ncbi:MAG: response regulator transcription factor [Chloroflexi bacterium]|nr:response regulator transcription factor [Chloroflexota bacterium]
MREALDALAGSATGDTTRATVALGAAEAARAAGDDAKAQVRWRELADRLDGLGDRYGAAYARWRAAEAELRARGTRGDAGQLLREAHAVATDLGARPMLTEVEALARRARVPLERPIVAQPAVAPETGSSEPVPGGSAALRRAGLSDREIEVLRLVAAGWSNGQIAERLFIARKTAGVHVTHILDKLGVANRVEAAMVAARLGLEPEIEDS